MTEKNNHTPSEFWFLSFTKRLWTKETNKHRKLSWFAPQPSSTLYHTCFHFLKCRTFLHCSAVIFTYIKDLSFSSPPWHFTESCVMVHCLGTINVCTKFWDNPSKSLQDISLTITNVNLLVELQQKSIGLILWGAWLSVQNVKSGPK